MLSTSDAIKVRKFDWNDGKYFPLHTEFDRGSKLQLLASDWLEKHMHSVDSYSWTLEDIEELKEASYIIAADGICYSIITCSYLR